MPTLGVLGGDVSWSAMTVLSAAGLDVLDVEPAPKQISPTLADRFTFGRSSVRCGALGDVRQILQLVQAATGARLPKNAIWIGPDGGYIDGLRPAVDPVGFASRADLAIYRTAHLSAVRRLLLGVETLVLPLGKTSGLVDAVDGTVYPRKVTGAKLPRGCKLVPTVYTVETMNADFEALHAALTAVRPGILIRLVVAEPVDGWEALLAQAQLRALAGHWAARHDNVFHDPILDHLITRMAQPGSDPKLGLLVRHLMAGGDLVDVTARSAAAGAAHPDPAGPVNAPRGEKPDRAKRRAERANRKAKDAAPKGNKVICEDELLEAFS